MMEKFQILRRIGQGSYGVVWSAFHKQTGEVVAIKKLNTKCYSKEECENLIEVKALFKLKHPNIVRLKEVVSIKGGTLFLIFECMEGSLYQRMNMMFRMQMRFSESEIRNLCFQVFEGLAHMHGNGYFHRDLKPDNLLLSKNVIKIADLGQARETNRKPPYTDYVTTRWYRSPEVLLHSPVHDPAVDMWAMGAIMAEMFIGRPLFAGGCAGQVLYKICSVIGSPTESNWSDGIQLARNMNFQFPCFPGVPLATLLPNASNEAVCLVASLLSWNPCMRPTAAEVLKHPFFDGCCHVIHVSQDLPWKRALLK